MCCASMEININTDDSSRKKHFCCTFKNIFFDTSIQDLINRILIVNFKKYLYVCILYILYSSKAFLFCGLGALLMLCF